MTRQLVRNAIFGLALFATGARGAESSRHEIGLTLGGLLSQHRGLGTNSFELSAGTALQANYGYRLIGGRRAALYGEVHLLANPQREVSSMNTGLTRDVASLFVTPGIRVKFAPDRAVAPYFAVGGGWSLFEHSTTSLAGQPNPAARTNSHGVFDYGGGVDIKFWRFVGLRGEVRDFYSGNPAYNVPLSGGQHNVVIGGGIVLKFGE
jgi:hypothetical protein